MNDETQVSEVQDSSSIMIGIRIEESWIARILEENQPVIPVTENIQLTNLKIAISEESLIFEANVKDKESTSIVLNALPVWDAENQYLSIQDLKFKTDTKNVLFKSAGLFAQWFLNEKIDKKLEEQANKMLNAQLQNLKEKPIDFPLPKGGTAKVQVNEVKILQLELKEKAVELRANVYAYLKARLA